MTSKEIVIDLHRQQGHNDALSLRDGFVDGELTPTDVIDHEAAVPMWTPKSYLAAPLGSPYQHENQVYKLLQPYDGTVFTDPPPLLIAQWGILHTKNPYKAKSFMTPRTSGEVYMTGDCCTEDTETYICAQDNISHPPSAFPSGWRKWEVD